MIIVTANSIVEACGRAAFRALFPEFGSLFNAWLQKPGCGECQIRLIAALADETKRDRLCQYFGGVNGENSDNIGFDIAIPESRAQRNGGQIIVINCDIHELEARLNHEVPPGPKQISVARFENQITAIINVLD